MPKPLLYLLLVFFYTLPNLGQTNIVGQVVDAATQEPLPYVNIGLVNQNQGTVSDEEGFFE
ncbi:MAG: carboxypeptidase-like regulatory domain-containing protein, partial [Bacteroidetes bacterium]|nr:carboxypeptidase-like regulatory domain-containing protein [Bacteroidota bacterium]